MGVRKSLEMRREVSPLVMKLTARVMKVQEEEAEVAAGDLAVAEDLVGLEDVGEAASSTEVGDVAEDSEDSEEPQEEDLSEEEEDEATSREGEEAKAALNSNNKNETSLFHYHQLASYFQHMLL